MIMWLLFLGGLFVGVVAGAVLAVLFAEIAIEAGIKEAFTRRL